MHFLKWERLYCVWQLQNEWYITGIFLSSFISLIRSSHTNVDDKDENPTLASLKSFPASPIFLATFTSCDLHICVCGCLHAVHSTHQLDPVTDVCAVVGIWKGVQQ